MSKQTLQLTEDSFSRIHPHVTKMADSVKKAQTEVQDLKESLERKRVETPAMTMNFYKEKEMYLLTALVELRHHAFAITNELKNLDEELRKAGNIRGTD